MEKEIIVISSSSDSDDHFVIEDVGEEVEIVRAEVTNSRSENKKENINSKKEIEKSSKSSEIPIGRINDTKEKAKKKAEEVKSPAKKSDCKGDEEKNKSKKVEEKDVEAEAEVQIENETTALYQFPMNRISRIIKSENSDIRMFSEAVFVINKASEKFLELFSKEAYACASQDRKKKIEYKHLSSVIPKRRRLEFLSDFVPARVKAADALKETSSVET